MTRPGRNDPEVLDPWERGFDAGWTAAADGRRRRIRSGFRLFPNGYWAGWREGYRIVRLVRPVGPGRLIVTGWRCLDCGHQVAARALAPCFRYGRVCRRRRWLIVPRSPTRPGRPGTPAAFAR